MKSFEQSKIWQHVKSGGLYTIIGHGVIVADLTPATIYRSLWDGAVWVRPTAEFEDGRFRNIAVDEVTDCRPEEDKFGSLQEEPKTGTVDLNVPQNAAISVMCHELHKMRDGLAALGLHAHILDRVRTKLAEQAVEIERTRSDPRYTIGHNDGWSAAMATGLACSENHLEGEQNA